jgi:hypothetical protein
MVREGWTMIYALKYSGESPAWLHTFGEHRPDYNPRYTFDKFMREGAKCQYRKAGFWSILRSLKIHTDSTALIAAIGVAHGLFLRASRDVQGPVTESEEFRFLEGFCIASDKIANASITPEDLVRGDLRNGFKRSFEAGVGLRRRWAPATFKDVARRLHQQATLPSWVAFVGLCHGLFFEEYREADAEEEFTILSEMLPDIARRFLGLAPLQNRPAAQNT